MRAAPKSWSKYKTYTVLHGPTKLGNSPALPEPVIQMNTDFGRSLFASRNTQHCIQKFQDNLLYETIKDLTEDFSFPNLNYMLAPNPPEKKMSLDNGETTSSFPSKRIKIEDALPTGDIPNPRFYTGHILYIYNNVVKVFYSWIDLYLFCWLQFLLQKQYLDIGLKYPTPTPTSTLTPTSIVFKLLQA